jgi:hypothetical protein
MRNFIILNFDFLIFMSGCWELNPVNMLPKHAYYRYTTPRKLMQNANLKMQNLGVALRQIIFNYERSEFLNFDF